MRLGAGTPKATVDGYKNLKMAKEILPYSPLIIFLFMGGRGAFLLLLWSLGIYKKT